MRLYNQLILLAAAVLLLPVACTKDLRPADGELITVEASIGAPTKVAYDGDKSRFADGDKIAVYAWTGSDSEVPAKRIVDGVVNTYDGSTWTPASLMRWRNGSDAHYFLGVSPVHAISDFTADEYTVNPADYAASDLLFAANLGGVKSGDGAVKLPFRHAMAKIVVNLSFRSQFDGTPEVGAVTLSAKMKASVNYLTQTVSATGEAATVSLPAVTANSSYSAILVPQKEIKKITVTIGGKDYVYDAGEDISLASGQVTTVNLTVGKDKLELASDITISDWVDDKLDDQEFPQDKVPFQLSACFPQAVLPMQDGWQTGDVLFVFFSGQAAPKYLEMKWNGTAWDCTPKNGLSLAASETGTMRAYYLLSGSDASIAADGADFAFSVAADCYLSASLPYTVSNGTVRGSFDPTLPTGNYVLFLADDNASADAAIELREPHLTPIALSAVDADGLPVPGSVIHGAPLAGYACTGAKKGYAFYGMLSEDAWGLATDYRFTLVQDGWQGTYSCLDLRGRILYVDDMSSRIDALPTSGWKAITDYKPIDLGLDVDMPDGTKKRVYWSSCNVGAENPQNYGSYFAWGEVEKKFEEVCTWADYKWGDGTVFSKYTVTGATLLPEDDAARKNLGACWRMPASSEWTALLDTNCFDWKWSDDYDETGTKGMVVTSKLAGCTGHSIFLPAAGGWHYDADDGVVHKRGTIGNYWTPTLSADHVDDACYIYFSSSESETRTDDRSCGMSVRPVTE